MMDMMEGLAIPSCKCRNSSCFSCFDNDVDRIESKTQSRRILQNIKAFLKHNTNSNHLYITQVSPDHHSLIKKTCQVKLSRTPMNSMRQPIKDQKFFFLILCHDSSLHIPVTDWDRDDNKLDVDATCIVVAPLKGRERAI